MLRNFLHFLNIIINNYVLLSIPISFIILFIFFNFNKVDYTNPTTFTKVETIQTNVSIDNYLLSCTLNVPIEKCFNSSFNSSKKRNVLLLGNSQTMSTVIRANISDNTAIKYLYDNVKQSDFLPISLSFPNANLQEQFLVLETITNKIQLDTLILPIFLDDTRENGVRTDVKVYTGFLSINNIENKSAPEKSVQTNNKLDAIAKGNLISVYADLYIPYWNRRSEIKNSIEYNIYLLRNFIFNIKKSSKRKINKSYYSINLDYLNKIIEHTTLKKIKLIVYMAPIPPGSSIYDEVEYTNFSNYLKNIKSENYNFYDLSDIIPKTSWVLDPNNSREYLDYMHFDGYGHMLLGNTLSNLLIK